MDKLDRKEKWIWYYTYFGDIRCADEITRIFRRPDTREELETSTVPTLVTAFNDVNDSNIKFLCRYKSLENPIEVLYF